MAVPRTDRWQAGAVAARTLLALFVIFGLVVFFLPTTPLGDQPAAAQTPSPSPTGPRVQFLNPSGSATSGPGKEVSGKNDTINTTYHLVAWVAEPPASPSVEFKYQQGSNPEITIGTGTLRGTNTYDIEWNLASVNDGTYVVKAILFGGTTEVARDSETVEVNNQDPTPSPGGFIDSEPQGQTIEMTYPQVAGTFGVFRKPGTSDPHFGVIDAGFSAGTLSIRAYYSTSAPGSEPQWTACNSSETAANAADGIRCTLASGANPTSVTAIAVATDDAAASPCSSPSGCGTTTDSGDAHSASGYLQVPSSVTVTAGQTMTDQDNATAGNQYACAPVIATVFDQVGRKVAGANVDVHSAGPTDNLFYDDTSGTGTPANSSGPNKAPDRNHGGLESTVDCENNAKPFSSDSQQGDHEVVGEGDIKHIETVTAGTTDAGQFKFQLYNQSTTVTGTTQITAWYDRDDDDLFCSAEPSGNGSIGWGTGPAAPSGLPSDTGTCSEPTPSGSPSGSPSSSPSASASASRSPSSSPSQSPQQSSRTITLVASDSPVLHGTSVTLSGSIFSSNSSCEDNEFIQINRRVHGSDTFSPFTTAQTDSDGAYLAQVVARKSADYQAVSNSHDNCATASSSPATVLVKVKVSIAVSDARLDRGETFVFSGKVTPNHRGTKVVLQRKKGGRWVKVATDTLNRRSRYRIGVLADWRGDRLFRVNWTSTDSDHESNVSNQKKVISRA